MRKRNSLNRVLTKFISFVLLMLITKVWLYSQNGAVSGLIQDATSGEPLIGATVVIKGTTTGTITDEQGRFILPNIPPDAVLAISFIGYRPLEEMVLGRNEINIGLLPEVRSLDEVVVTALGIKREVRKLGYNIQEVKGEEYIKAREPNPINSLVGQIAGLNIGSSAELLGSPNISLRGRTPVFIVDGVPVNSDSWSISPDDIESYTVLKGNTAAALYGSRGQYGAIMITTKKGNHDKRSFSVEVNSSTMFEESFLTIPKVQDEYGPGDHGKYWFVDGKGGGINDADYDIWGPKFEGQLIAQYDSPIDPETGERIPTPWIARGKDNLKRFIETGILTANNLTLSSSADNYSLRLSATYTYQKGIVPNTQLNTANFNIGTTIKLTKKLSAESNINFSRQFTPNFPDVQYGPNSIIYNIIFWGGADWDIDDMKDYWQEGKEGVQQIYAEYFRYNNPYFLCYEWLRGHYKTDIIGTVAVKYDITKSLNLNGRTHVNTYELLRTEKFPYSAGAYGREGHMGDYREDKRSLFESNSDLYLYFAKILNPVIGIEATLGTSIRNMQYNAGLSSTDYLMIPGWYNMNNSLNDKRTYNYSAGLLNWSNYGYTQIAFKESIFAEFTGRWEKNSTLTKSYFYPSVSLSSVLSELFNTKALSYLKLRGSWAQVSSALTRATIGPIQDILDYGSDYYSPYNGPTYENTPAYNITFPYNNQAATGFTNIITNPDLKAEKSVSYEAGVDFKILKNRLGADITYFNTIDGPKIYRREISTATGYSTMLENSLKTQRNGLEITIFGNPVKLNRFNWDVLANWSTFKEIYKELPEGLEKVNTYYREGDRVDGYYSTAIVRTKDGQIINDASGRPINNPINQFLGYTNPDWSWGLRNNFSYRNLSLTIKIDVRVGGIIIDQVKRQSFRGGRHIETVKGDMGVARYNDYLGIQSWKGEGVVVSNGVAIKYDNEGRISNYDELEFAPNETLTYLQDWISRYYRPEESSRISRTYIKLREITLSYNIPKKILEKSFIRSASISLVGRNLLYLAEEKDIDIDQFAVGASPSGSSYNILGYAPLQTPTTRRFGFNLNLLF